MRLVKQISNILWWRLGGKNPLFGPLRVQWDLTYQCNSRCLHCSRWQEKYRESFKKAPELTTEQGKRLIDQLVKLGTIHLTFSGNEPLLRKDIFELVQYAKRVGLKVTFLTNGLIVGKEIARQIVVSGVDVLFFSLDGSTAQINDRVRGVKGAFEKSLRAIEFCQKARGGGKMKIMAVAVASKNNLGDLENIIKLAQKIGLDGLIIQPLVSFSIAGKTHRSLNFSKKDIQELNLELERVIDKYGDFIPVMKEYYQNVHTFFTNPKKLYRYPCSAAFLSLDIHPNGDFAPCPVWGEVMGNFVEEDSVEKIWFSKKAQKVRKKIKEGKHPICWAGCLWPTNLYLFYLHPLRFYKMFDLKMLRYIFRKIGF